MARFGPEFKQYYAKTLDFHLEGDVGIGDLVYANTYWAQDDTWVNEYSEYMQYVNTGPPNNYTAVNRQGFACQTARVGRRPRQVTRSRPSAAAASRPSSTTTPRRSTVGRMSCGCSRKRTTDCGSTG